MRGTAHVRELPPLPPPSLPATSLLPNRRPSPLLSPPHRRPSRPRCTAWRRTAASQSSQRRPPPGAGACPPPSSSSRCGACQRMEGGKTEFQFQVWGLSEYGGMGEGGLHHLLVSPPPRSRLASSSEGPLSRCQRRPLFPLSCHRHRRPHCSGPTPLLWTHTHTQQQPQQQQPSRRTPQQRRSGGVGAARLLLQERLSTTTTSSRLLRLTRLPSAARARRRAGPDPRPLMTRATPPPPLQWGGRTRRPTR